MAIDITNSQGTKVYIAATANAAVADATEVATAIAAGNQIGCIQDLGGLSSSVSVQEYTCLSSNESAKSTGSRSQGNFTVGMLFSAADAAGQAELKTMYDGGQTRTFIIEFNDNGGTNPTYETFEGFVSTEDIVAAKDNAVMVNMTVEIASARARILAS